MSSARSWYPVLASPLDAVQLVAHDPSGTTWPPPGTHVVPVAHPEPWALVVEDSYGSADTDGGPYWTPLSEFVTDMPATAAGILIRAASRVGSPLPPGISVIGHWPVVWDPTKGQTMRWLKSTFRGTLGGIEAFQHKIDWGHPGQDPDLTEGGQLDLATLLATEWRAIWDKSGGLKTLYSNEVKYTEVGVVQCTQTDATTEDDKGNLEQANTTQWFGWPANNLPVGTALAATLPYEVATCVTMLTNTRGPSGRGRFYLPPLSINSMGTLGLFPSAQMTQIATRITEFLAAVKNATDYVPVVVSRRRIQLHEITRVEIGVVPDSQRRRRKSQDEARVGLAVGGT